LQEFEDDPELNKSQVALRSARSNEMDDDDVPGEEKGEGFSQVDRDGDGKSGALGKSAMFFKDLIGDTKLLLGEMDMIEQKQVEARLPDEAQELITKKLRSELPHVQEDRDLDLAAYRERKNTILGNVKELSKAKFKSPADQSKADELVHKVGFYLEKDEQNLKKARQSMRKSNTKHLTEEERR